MKMKIAMYSMFGLCCTLLHAIPLTITPKTGVIFPTQMTSGYDVQAYYTVTNNTGTDFTNLYVQYLPLNVEQITTGGLYSDTCGATFNLAAGASATLELNISGPVISDSSDPQLNLFICSQAGLLGCGTRTPLNIVESPFLPLAVSYEIIYTGSLNSDPAASVFVETYKEGGTNPITEDEWNSYTPPAGYLKNDTRYLQFNEQIYIGSPGTANGNTLYITTTGGTPSDGYTWGQISDVVNAMWPWDTSLYPGTTSPFEAGNFVSTPVTNGVKVTTNYKAQIMKFYACENGVDPSTPGAVFIDRYYITDQWGNKYIMHASNFDNPTDIQNSLVDANLPAGWTYSIETLSEDFYLMPAQGADGTYNYTLLRDCQSNTFHQMHWSTTPGTVVTSQIQAAGMPIWGGTTDDVLLIDNGFDNVIYGGGGVNTFAFYGSEITGINTIVGFNPTAGDILNFDGAPYDAVIYADGVHITLYSGVVVILAAVFIFDDAWVVS